ncbi:MAG: hypothetical protein K0R99_4580 [Microbacterium sp.]|nr:hypothetical protein [Microbacterium sp.]
MTDEHNPLLPAGYDIAWSVVAALVIALTLFALIGLARSATRLTGWQGTVWAALIVLVPVIGPMAWLMIGQRVGTVSTERGRP